MIRGAGRLTKRTDERANHLTPVHFCGGARVGYEAAGCGAALVYDYTANGLEHWRCPACGNPHWWRVPTGLYPLPPDPDPVLPGRVMDGRQLLAPVPTP